MADIVVIAGIRYRRRDAKRLGLLKAEEPAAPAAEPDEPALAADPECAGEAPADEDATASGEAEEPARRGRRTTKKEGAK